MDAPQDMPATTALRVVDLRTERRTEPLGIDEEQPLLSWRLEGAGRRRTQTSYRVRVVRLGTGPDLPDPRVETEEAVWDTGQVVSGRSIDVPYEGPPLESATRYRWAVRVRDEGDQDLGWSATADFETGLLTEEDWQAEWIGAPRDLELRGDLTLDMALPLRNIERIWLPASGQEELGCPPAGSTARFLAEVTVPGGRPVLAARLVVAGATSLHAWINGRPVPSDGSDPAAVTAAVRTGRNVLAVSAQAGDGEQPGLIARLEVLQQGGPALTLITDGHWRVSPPEQGEETPSPTKGAPAWTNPTHELSSWAMAEVFGVHADPPRAREALTYRPSPYLRRSFVIDRRVRRARLSVTALGVYEMRLGGRPVSEDRLAPGWTDYAQRVPYQTYDVTDQIAAGENVLAAVLADGWYAGNICWFGTFHYGDRRLLRARLVVEHDDGSSTVVTTGPDWQVGDGAIRYADLQNGEVVDARLEPTGWDTLAGSPLSADWPAAVVDHPAVGPLEAQVAPPVRVTQDVPPVSVVDRGDGRYLVDFGQNLVGWVRLDVQGPAGARVALRHAEALDGPELYTDNLRSARCVDEFVLAGSTSPERFEPRFTVHGFRYCEVVGHPGTLRSVDIVARVAHAAMEPTGSIQCSDERINQLQANIGWGQRGNFLSVPTDCPQRDERLGWTGDAQVFAATAAFNYDVRGFFRKYLRDLQDATVDGCVPHVAPDVLTPASPSRQGGAAGWGDVAVIMPHELVRAYDDRRSAAELLPLVTDWMDYLARHSVDGIRPAEGFGDWLALTDTPVDLVSTAFYARAAELAAGLADLLGERELATSWTATRERVRRAFRDRYVTGGGTVASGTQTAYVLALHFGLLEPAERVRAASRLVEAVRTRNWHLSTGFLGTPYLLPVLSRTGHEDVAYRLLMQDTFPSWLYPVVDGGATTVWERWDSWSDSRGFADPGMTSFNHYAYGAVGEWIYRTVGGIAPAEPGYRRVLIRPRPGGGLTWAKASLHTPYGTVRTKWWLDISGIRLDLTVPPGSTAEVVLPVGPDDQATAVTESGMPFDSAPQVRSLARDAHEVVLDVGSGTYSFAVDRAG